MARCAREQSGVPSQWGLDREVYARGVSPAGFSGLGIGLSLVRQSRPRPAAFLPVIYLESVTQ